MPPFSFITNIYFSFRIVRDDLNNGKTFIVWLFFPFKALINVFLRELGFDLSLWKIANIFFFVFAGGLVCRGILSTLPDHNVHSFISLSSPQAGQYGGGSGLIEMITDGKGLLGSISVSFCFIISFSYPLSDTDYLKYLFPQFVKSNLYHLCYTAIGQRISICNYWNGEALDVLKSSDPS